MNRKDYLKVFAVMMALLVAVTATYSRAYSCESENGQFFGVAEEYGIYVRENTIQHGDSEANIATYNLRYDCNVGAANGVGNNYVENEFVHGNHVRGAQFLFGSKDCIEGIYKQNGMWKVKIKGEDRIFNMGTLSQVTYVGYKTDYKIGETFQELEELAAELAELEDAEAVVTNSRNSDWIVLKVQENAKNIISLDASEIQNKKICIKVSGSKKEFAATDTQLIVNVNVKDMDTEEIVLNQLINRAGYGAYDNTDRIIWNFGNYEGKITLNETCGAILAPKADVTLRGGNHIGRIIAKNLVTYSEVHFIPKNKPENETVTEVTTSGCECTTKEETTTETEYTTEEETTTESEYTTEEETTTETECTTKEEITTETEYTTEEETTTEIEHTTEEETTTESEYTTEEETTTESEYTTEEETTTESEYTTEEETTTEIEHTTEEETTTESEYTTEEETTTESEYTTEEETTTERDATGDATPDAPPQDSEDEESGDIYVLETLPQEEFVMPLQTADIPDTSDSGYEIYAKSGILSFIFLIIFEINRCYKKRDV